MKPARLLVNKLHAPVTVLGPGRRIGLWLQGCSIHCKGCVSTDTWDFDPRRSMTVDDVLAWCRAAVARAAAAGEQITGLTISGGEPFDQADGLRVLVDRLQKNRDNATLDLLCYSGYPLKTLEAQHGDLLARFDAVIPEPYVDALPLEKRWRGSANQPLVLLSDRGRERFAADLDTPAPKEMQVAVDGQRIWFIGLPDRGDMTRLEDLCRQRGIDFANASWRR